MFLRVSSLQYSVIHDKIGKINTLKKIVFFLFFTISKKHFFVYGFSKKKSIKKQNFPHWMKEIFFAEKKRKKMKKKTIKVRTEIFQENKRERNLKAINCQKLLYAN